MELIQVLKHPEDWERNGSLILPKEAGGDEVLHQVIKADISRRLLKLSFPLQSNHLQGHLLSPDKGFRVVNTHHDHDLLTGNVLTRMDPTSKTDAQDDTPIQWQHSHLAGTQVECPGVMEILLIPRPQDVVVQGHARNAQKMVEAQTLQESTILGPPSS
jgi:hypothetical protein